MTKQKIVVGGLAAAVAVTVAAACSQDFPSLSVKAPPKEVFTATLVPASEVPPASGVNSSGTVTVTLMDTITVQGVTGLSANTVRVETRVSTIDSVTQAHIHAGGPTVAGPVKVWLLPFISAGRAPITGTDRTLNLVDVLRTSPICNSTGSNSPCFTARTGTNPPVADWTIDSLIVNMRAGNTYVNVHTKKFPGGEIRGQLAKP